MHHAARRGRAQFQVRYAQDRNRKGLQGSGRQMPGSLMNGQSSLHRGSPGISDDTIRAALAALGHARGRHEPDKGMDGSGQAWSGPDYAWPVWDFEPDRKRPPSRPDRRRPQSRYRKIVQNMDRIGLAFWALIGLGFGIALMRALLKLAGA